jgi:hypothetical protein
LAERFLHLKDVAEKERMTPTKEATRLSAGAARDVARVETIARKLAKVAPNDDPARVAGAIAIFATETIKRSANILPEARAYLVWAARRDRRPAPQRVPLRRQERRRWRG